MKPSEIIAELDLIIKSCESYKNLKETDYQTAKDMHVSHAQEAARRIKVMVEK